MISQGLSIVRAFHSQLQRLPIFSSKDPKRSLTWAYVVALGVIAILTVASHVLTVHITNKQKESTEVAYQIGRQRALVQQIMLYASQYYTHGEQLDYDLLEQSVREMEGGHDFLIRMVNAGGLIRRPVSRVLVEVYYDHPYYLDSQIVRFIEASRHFANIPVTEPSAVRRDAMDVMTKDLSGSMIRGLDVALERYQNETAEQINRYYILQFWSAIFVLIVLLVEAVFIFRPLVQRIGQYHSMLLRQALEDSLTGLSNRRAFMKRAAAELRRAERAGDSFAIVLTDLDSFKAVNDTYGHKVGDLVLQHFAGIMLQSLRSEDIIGRIGGEEFAIMLPRANAEKAFQVIERLRQATASTPCNYVDENEQDQSLAFSASFGMVVTSGPWNIDDLLREADDHLYEAKRKGRNRVVMAQLAQEEPQAKTV